MGCNGSGERNPGLNMRTLNREGHHVAADREGAYPDKRGSNSSSGSFYEKENHHKKGALGMLGHKDRRNSSSSSSKRSYSNENRGRNNIKGAGNVPIDHHTKPAKSISNVSHEARSRSGSLSKNISGPYYKSKKSSRSPLKRKSGVHHTAAEGSSRSHDKTIGPVHHKSNSSSRSSSRSRSRSLGKYPKDHYRKSKSPSNSKEEEKSTSDTDKLAYLLKKHKIDDKPKLGNDYYLYLDLNENYNGVVNFLREADEYEFDRLRKLSIIGVEKLSEKDLHHISEITKKGKLKKLDILYLNGGLNTDLSRLSEFLIHLLQITRKQVFIDSFKMTDQDLQILLEYSHKVKNLSVVNWELAEFSNSFSLSTKPRHRMKVLDLFWSAVRDDKDMINSSTLIKILKAIDDSKLGDTLKCVHVCEEDYPKHDLEKQFEKLNHKYHLKVDYNQPKPFP